MCHVPLSTWHQKLVSVTGFSSGCFISVTFAVNYMTALFKSIEYCMIPCCTFYWLWCAKFFIYGLQETVTGLHKLTVNVLIIQLSTSKWIKIVQCYLPSACLCALIWNCSNNAAVILLIIHREYFTRPMIVDLRWFLNRIGIISYC